MFKKVKLWVFFTEDMILNIENPRDSTRKLLEIINEFSVKLQDVKSTCRNQWCFHTLKTKYRGEKNNENNPIHHSTKHNEIRRNKFNQKDLYNEKLERTPSNLFKKGILGLLGGSVG